MRERARARSGEPAGSEAMPPSRRAISSSIALRSAEARSE